MPYDTGEIIYKLRKQKNWTQKKLAEKLEVSESTVCKYESGAIQPTIDILRALSSIFKISMDELCGTTPKGYVSVHGLSDNQKEIILELVDMFRNPGSATPGNPAERFAIIGKITTELTK